MWIIVIGESKWGPFKSADAAAKWAAKNFENYRPFHIERLRAIS